MKNSKDYDKIANKLAAVDGKFAEIKFLVKTLNIWIKENNYNLIELGDIIGISGSRRKEVLVVNYDI